MKESVLAREGEREGEEKNTDRERHNIAHANSGETSPSINHKYLYKSRVEVYGGGDV